MMRSNHLLFGTCVLVLASLATAAPGRSDPVRLVASDDRGVTLRLDVPDFNVRPEADGFASLRAGLLAVTSEPGRPGLPFGAALIALPPGARAVASVQSASAEETREGVRLATNGRSVIRDDGSTLGPQPTVEDVEAIHDGAWPASPVTVSAPFFVRRQRVVSVRILPFRYDPAAGRLWARRSITVRVEFAGTTPGPQGLGAGETDRHWEPVLRRSILNYTQGRSWREAPAAARPAGGSLFPRLRPTAAGARATAVIGFDEDNPEVRVRTDTTGIYAILEDDLESKGFPTGIPIDRISVHRHEFLEGANPAYGTVELPIEIDDANADSVFDSGDAIYVFVQSWADRSHASWAQRAWGDGEVLFATYLTGRPGLRMAARPAWRGETLTPLASYPYTRRFELNRFYYSSPPDTNTDQFHWDEILSYVAPESVAFETNDLDTSGAARFAVQWIGRKNLTRWTWAQIRNNRSRITAIADSVRWTGIYPLTQAADVPGSAFTEGLTNVMRTWGKNTTGPAVANVALNYFEASYWRRFRALEGLLSCNTGSAAGAFEIDAGGFSTNFIRVYDVTDSLAAVRLIVDASHVTFDGSQYTVAFQDSVAGPRRSYVVFDRPKLVPPENLALVTRRNLAGAPPSDYLMVVPEAFQDAVTPLADLRRSQGFRVLVAPLESINDEFNGGRHSAHSIRRFLKYAYDNWNAEFVVLCGDGSEDPMNLTVYSGPDYVPAQKILGPIPSGDLHETIPSDNWYGSFHNPDLPDLFIGRIPADSPEDLAGVVHKIVKYENVGADETWRRDMFLLADDQYSTTNTFGGGAGSVDYCKRDYERVFLALNDTVRSIIRREAGLSLGTVELFDVEYQLRNEPFHLESGDTCRDSWPDTQRRSHATVTPLIFQSLNAGRLWWNYQGHANQYVLAHEDLYVNRGGNDDKDLFTNVDRPFLFTAFSCHPNGFARPGELGNSVGPSLGEDMVMLPDRGAIASWGSSGFELLPTPVDRPEHLNTHFARALLADPPRDESVPGSDARALIGEVIGLTLVRNFTYEENGGGNLAEQQVGRSYVLLGDPATRISIGPAQITVTANGQPVTSGEPVRLTTIGDSLRIEADIVSNVGIDSLRLDPVAPSEYTVTPEFPDTLTGGRHYHLIYRATLGTRSTRYAIVTRDHFGVPDQFDIVFPFETVLNAEKVAIRDGDFVSTNARLTLSVLSPRPIQPSTEMTLNLDGAGQSFTATPIESSGREWTLAWDPPPYAAGSHVLKVNVNGELFATHTFAVSNAVDLTNLIAFPNPFDEELGLRFSFTFVGPQPFDLLLRVYTVAGKVVYERNEKSLQPGYHQLPWDGRDAEGDFLSNGIYFYKLAVRSPAGSLVREGRLVKLRRPHHTEPTE